MNIKDIHINPRNPRYIRDERYQQLKKSIKEFPKMMRLRPIIIDNDGMILGGNMRYLAMVDLGYGEIPEGWVVKASDLTEEEQRKFKIVDNIPFGDWDYDILANEWDFEELKGWGMVFPEMEDINIKSDEKEMDESVETKNECPKCGYKW
jgi:ParB-like chromosome segregation protein Spo0J